jgi:hypothetical protein
MEPGSIKYVMPPPHSESYINILINTLKNNIFYSLNNANEYWQKAKNNKSTIQLNGIPTFLLTFLNFLSEIRVHWMSRESSVGVATGY